MLPFFILIILYTAKFSSIVFNCILLILNTYHLNILRFHMSDFNNIGVTHLEDGMVSLLVDGKPISEKYGMKFEATIIQELQALENGKNIKLFDQFVFSHTDLNFEHSYHYVTSVIKEDDTYRIVTNFVYKIVAPEQAPFEHVITKQGEPLSPEDVREFINAHVQKSLTDYTDMKYAY